MNFRILITGSRSWDDIEYIRATFAQLAKEIRNDITLVSGACPTGADRLGEIVAAELGWDIERYPANWNQHGRSAGFIRNTEMVETNPDLVVAFIRNKSKGATMTANLSKKKELFTIVHNWTDYPKRNMSVKEFKKGRIYDAGRSKQSLDDEGTLF